MWFYYALFFLILIFSFISEKKELKSTYYTFSFIILFFVTAFRSSDCGSDYVNYVSYYYESHRLSYVFLEPTFFAISNLSRIIFNSPIGIFIIYALISLLIKYFAIRKLTAFYNFSIFLFIPFYFLNHEMTQIRTGVATGFLLLSIVPLYEKNVKKFLFLILVGSMFHYSLCLFAVFYFINSKEINLKLYLFVFGLAYFFYFLNIDVVSLVKMLKFDMVVQKVEAYERLMKEGQHTKINVFNSLLLIRIFVLFFIMIYYKKIVVHNKYVVLLLKIYAFSLLFFIVFYKMPILAFRMSQLLGIVEIVLFPLMLFVYKQKEVVIAFLILYSLLVLSLELFYNNLMNPYF